MRIQKLTSSERSVIDRNAGLRAYLTALEAGRAGTPHSWLYEKEDANVTLQRWLDILRQLEHGNAFEKEVFQFDLRQVEKFGQQGIIPPISEAIKVESFQEQYDVSPSHPGTFRTLNEILGIQQHSILYRSFDAVVDDMRERDTLTTNSGWNLFTRRQSVAEISKQQARDGVAWTFPAIILFRHYNGKLRVVWMYPMAMNLLEYQATQPLQDIIQKHTQYVTPWKGFEHVKARFTELWRAHPYAFGGDTTAMDAHMQPPQNKAVADAFSPLFADPTQATQSLFRVNEIPLVVGQDAIIRDAPHGVASGSGWTQLTETIFQILMFDRYNSTYNTGCTIEDGMGIGDDYVWFFNSKPNSKEIVKYWQDAGLPGKPEKQSNEDNSCTFLQRLFIKGWFSRDDSAVLGGIYPTVRALNSLLWPERYHNPKDWNSDMFCVRCFMILENVVDHPLFEQFVQFVVKGQKDLLPFAKSLPSVVDQAMARSRLLPGLVPTYNQEKREKPLSEFTSIKYARSL